MSFVAPLMMATCVLLASDDPSQVKKDPQSTFEPRSAPGEGQKLLEKFVGDWSVSKAFYPQAGEPIRAEGLCRQSMIHGGRFLQSEFVFGEGDKKTTGLGIIGFDPDSGLFTSVWTDSRSTRMSARQSKNRFDGRTIELFSRSLDADGKESRRTRTATRLEEEGRKLVHRQYAITPDGKERLMMDLVMTRKAPAATGKQPGPSQ